MSWHQSCNLRKKPVPHIGDVMNEQKIYYVSFNGTEYRVEVSYFDDSDPPWVYVGDVTGKAAFIAWDNAGRDQPIADLVSTWRSGYYRSIDFDQFVAKANGSA